MGCTSSAHTYPGDRLKQQQAQQQPYTPNASQFNSNGQATANFASHGGGNALVLQQGGMAHPQVGAIPQSNYSKYETTSYTPPATATGTTTAYPANDRIPPPPSNNNHDDGFASGFNNPGFVPASTTSAAGSNYTSYPSANDAKPVYSSAPVYPASTY